MDSAAPATLPDDPSWPQDLRTLVARGEPRRYRKGTLLIQEGDVGETLFIVLSGRVKSFSTDDRDREIVYGVYGPGEYLGEMSLDGGPRSASVITLEATVCSVVTRKTLREHIAANPEFAFELISRVIRRARLATQSARNMALLDVYGRVTRLLDELAQVQADGTRLIVERLTHADIASRVGCSREMVSRLLKDLEQGGYISVDAGRFHLAPTLPPRW
ncbi:MAG: cyclic nucleotide-binding domain-containing protein [Rhizobacter sp.]|nr:cyclic nucleotide-binding domain-containing protein [Rhizobacter sp.]